MPILPPIAETTDAAAVANGVLRILGAAFFFSLSFAAIKALGPEIPTTQVMFFRMGIGLLVLIPLFAAAPRGVLRTSRPLGHLYRIAAGFTSMALIYWALPRMPLADAVATQFTMPLFLTALSFPLLGERVGWRRATATVLGFSGVLLMLRPGEAGFGALNLAYAAAIASALLYALAVVAMRQLGQTEPPLRTTFYFTAVAALAGGAGCLFDWRDPSLEQWALLLGTGVVGGIGQYLLVSAYARAPATIVAPFDYSQLIWAAGLGLLLWNEAIRLETAAGALIVAGAGLYIFRREARLRQ